MRRSSFEYANKAIYCHRGVSNAEEGKVYDILDRKGDGRNTKFKIEPGWYSRSSFRPYYDVDIGDILISTERVYISRGDHADAGEEFKVASSRIVDGYVKTQRITVICPSGRKKIARHRHFKPAKRTIREKVELI